MLASKPSLQDEVIRMINFCRADAEHRSLQLYDYMPCIQVSWPWRRRLLSDLPRIRTTPTCIPNPTLNHNLTRRTKILGDLPHLQTTPACMPNPTLNHNVMRQTTIYRILIALNCLLAWYCGIRLRSMLQGPPISACSSVIRTCPHCTHPQPYPRPPTLNLTKLDGPKSEIRLTKSEIRLTKI